MIGKMVCENAEEYWDFMTEIAAPFVEALSHTDEETKENIRGAVINSMNEKYPDQTAIDSSANIIYAEK